MQAISQHPHHRSIHLAKAKMPATLGPASKLTSFPRVLLVKSSWAFTPSTLLLLGINELIVLNHRWLPAKLPAPHNTALLLLHIAAHKGRSSKTRRGAGPAGGGGTSSAAGCALLI